MEKTSHGEVAHSAREHSDIVGGSSAERILNCPASHHYLSLLPDEVKNKSSVYADEGTALHEAMQYILENDIIDADEVLGETFGVSDSSPEGFVMTAELVDTCIKPCMEFFDNLCDELDAEGGVEFLIEKRCQLPGIPGAFGTSDIIFRTAKRSGIVDWKFGAGIPVKAEYPDEEGVMRPNSQPMFYARSGMFTCPEMFSNGPDWPVDLYIVQPRSRFYDEGDPIFSKRTVTVKELEEFRIRLVAAVAEAMGKDARCKKGPWCAFQACKAVCPEHTGPLLDLSKVGNKLAKTGQKNDGFDWGEFFGLFLDIAKMSEEVIAEGRKLAHAYMEAGRPVSGWKLVAKRATEKYTDEAGAQRHAIGVGVPEKDTLTEPSLKSPAQLAAAMEPHMEGKTKKDRTTAAREQLKVFTADISSGTTVAPDSDGRVDVTPTPVLLNNLAKKLASLA